MNIIMLLHCLTLAFVFAKLAMSVEMSWWLVASPSLVGLGIAVILGMTYAIRIEFRSQPNLRKGGSDGRSYSQECGD